MSFDNPFDDLERAEEAARAARQQQRRPAKIKDQFDDALGQVTSRDVARAANKKTFQGKYWLRTLRLPPEYQDLTREIYQQEVRAKSLAEIERWIYTMGLIAYLHEGKRPEYNESVSRDIELPPIEE